MKRRNSRFTIRLDAETLELVKSKGNLSKYIRHLIKKDLTEKVQRIAV